MLDRRTGTLGLGIPHWPSCLSEFLLATKFVGDFPNGDCVNYFGYFVKLLPTLAE